MIKLIVEIELINAQDASTILQEIRWIVGRIVDDGKVIPGTKVLTGQIEDDFLP